MNNAAAKTPVHLWIVGILALLWNAMGAFDYTATKLQLDFYMGKFSEAQLEYFYNFPTWAVVCWAIAVWSSLLGSVALLMKKAFADYLFGLAILAMIGTSIYNFVLSNGMEIMGEGAMTITVMIWVIALFLFFYATAMAKRRVLT